MGAKSSKEWKEPKMKFYLTEDEEKWYTEYCNWGFDNRYLENIDKIKSYLEHNKLQLKDLFINAL